MVKTIAIEWFWNHSPRFKPWAMEKGCEGYAKGLRSQGM